MNAKLDLITFKILAINFLFCHNFLLLTTISTFFVNDALSHLNFL